MNVLALAAIWGSVAAASDFNLDGRRHTYLYCTTPTADGFANEVWYTYQAEAVGNPVSLVLAWYDVRRGALPQRLPGCQAHPASIYSGGAVLSCGDQANGFHIVHSSSLWSEGWALNTYSFAPGSMPGMNHYFLGYCLPGAD